MICVYTVITLTFRIAFSICSNILLTLKDRVQNLHNPVILGPNKVFGIKDMLNQNECKMN